VKILSGPLSGSQAGVTAAGGGTGTVLRRRAIPRQPLQTLVNYFPRAQFSASARAWAGLTDQQRAAWSSYGGNVSVTDSLGVSHTLTGFNAFMQVNMNPTINLPANAVVPATRQVFQPSGFTPSVSGSFVQAVSQFDGNGPNSSVVIVSATRPMSPGKKGKSTFYSLATFAGDDNSSEDITGQYLAKFGNPITGWTQLFRLVAYNFYGVAGQPVIVSVPIT
jgi:hypothetical protein